MRIEKSAFITPQGLCYYKVMPFGLKNACATYQWLMTRIFKPLIGLIVEVYIDDIVIKSKNCFEHLHHLEEAFKLMHKHDMKLSSLKCVFRVSSSNL